MATFSVEYTDTFGGEANYSWVRRETVTMPDQTNLAWSRRTFDRELMRKAKAAVGLTGVRGVTYHHGDMSEFRPRHSCTVLFVTYQEDAEEAE